MERHSPSETTYQSGTLRTGTYPRHVQLGLADADLLGNTDRVCVVWPAYRCRPNRHRGRGGGSRRSAEWSVDVRPQTTFLTYCRKH